jgi:transmembrane sensor
MTKEPMGSNRPDDPELWEKLARHLAGEDSASDAAAVREWLAAEPTRAHLVDALDESLRRLDFVLPADLDVEGALRHVSARLTQPDVRPLSGRKPVQEPVRLGWRTMGLRAAAVVALLLGAAVVWRAVRSGEPEAPVVAAQTFETSVGQTDSVHLSDGTVVLLGPDSRLTVAAGYGDALREVQLDGMALFDVRHEDARPFTVRAGQAVIVDLGTTFTVRSIAQEEVRVVVTSGSVRLQPAGGTEAAGVVLRAGDRGVLSGEGRAIAEPGTAVDDDVAWTRGNLVFNGEPIEHVAAELHRWYGLELRFDSTFAGRHLTARFEDESPREVVNIVALILGARVEQSGDTLVLRATSAATTPR